MPEKFRMKILKLILIAVASIALVGTAQAWTLRDGGRTKNNAETPLNLTGRDLVGIPSIHDGDTVTVSGVKVRLAGIDAPEKDQFCLDSKSQPWACGEAALAELAKKAGDRPWTCHVSGKDRYDRLLGSCRVDGEDIQRWLVRAGLALSYTKYSHVYDADEKTAREERAGLWSGAFIRPEAWRHRDKATEILAAVSVPVDAQKILLQPSPTPSPGPTATPPTAPMSATTTHTPTSTPSGATIHVRGYTRKDGTTVAPYDRRAPSPHKR